MNQDDKKPTGYIESMVASIPKAVKRFLVPGGCAIGTLVVMGLSPTDLQEYMTYAGLVVTAITGFTEYQSFVADRKAAIKVLDDA